MKKTIILIMAFTFTTLSASNVKNMEQTGQYGNVYTQYNFALKYKNAPKAQRDLRNAFKLFHKSALKGYSLSQYELGLMFHYGEGVHQNVELARLWLTRAAKKGHPQAQLVLYRFYSAKKPQVLRTQASRYTMNFRTYR